MGRSASSWFSSLRASPSLRAVAPWLGVLVLNTLFVLPAVARQLPRQPLLIFTPSGDLLVLLALCTAVAGFRHAAWVRRGSVAVLLLLWLYMWPAMIGQIIIRQAPLLYDLLFLAKHVGILLMDLWTWSRFAALLGAVLVLTLAGWLGWRLFSAVVGALARRPARHLVRGIGVMLMALFALALFQDRRHVVGVRVTGPVVWTSPALVSNLGKSFTMYQRIKRGIEHSPYAQYRDSYRLDRKPDVHLFLVESYGRILFSHPDIAERWRGILAHHQQRLQDAGWHVVSGFSRAPVSGGGSWMAEATVLTGIRVRYEAVFRHLVDDIQNTPNLVRFLDSQGYQTVLLAPKDRARPGLPLENRYDYDTTVFALDLKYEGPPIGWGIIPDQYSLGFAHEYVFSRSTEPLFTNFHMVSSHAPWSVVPSIVEDWRALGGGGLEDAEEFEGSEGESASAREPGPGKFRFKELSDRLRHFKRFRAPRYAYMGDVDGLKLTSFAQAIDYDLEILVQYLEQLDGDKLVIIMGDHQPPLVSEADDTYDVPVHVLARDPALLEEFSAAGFSEGMDLNDGRFTTILHEALFSMVVRGLVRCCAEPGTEPPVLRPNGIHIGN